MNGFETAYRASIVSELHTLAGNLQYAGDAKQLREKLRRLQQLEQQLIDLIAEVEQEPKRSPERRAG